MLNVCCNDEHPTRVPRPTKKPDKDNIIRAKFLRFLLLGGDENSPIHEEGVRLAGAWVDGDLILDGAVLPRDAALYNCWFDGKISLIGVQARRVELDGSRVLQLAAEGAEIRGDIFLRDNFHTERGVRLSGATVTGDFDCRASTFEDLSWKERALPFGGDAINFDRATIGGCVFLNAGFRATGKVSFHATKITGNLDCGNGIFETYSGPALAFEGAQVGGSVFLGEQFSARGSVCFPGTRIRGDLSCQNGRFVAETNADGYADALALDGAVIDGSVWLCHGFSATGVVRLPGATINGDFHCESGSFKGAPMKELVKKKDNANIALNMNRARVGGRFFLREMSAVQGNMSFTHTHVGVLADDATRPAAYEKPGAGRQDSYLYLDGFTYGRVLSGTDVSWRKRLPWLLSQPPKLLSKESFRPQPWEQLVKVLREMGHLEQARMIAIEKERHVYKIGKGIWYTRPFHWLYGVLAGYGHRHSLLVEWMLGVWLACGLFYYWAASEALFGRNCSRPPFRPTLAGAFLRG